MELLRSPLQGIVVACANDKESVMAQLLEALKELTWRGEVLGTRNCNVHEASQLALLEEVAQCFE